MENGDSEADLFKILGPDRGDIEQSLARTQALRILAEEGYGKSIIIDSLQPKGPSEDDTARDPDAFSLATDMTQTGHVVLCQNGRLVEVAIPIDTKMTTAQAYLDSFAVSPVVAYPRPKEYLIGAGAITSFDGLIRFYEHEGWVKNDSSLIGIKPFVPIVRKAIAVSSELRRRPPVIQARVYREVYGAFLRNPSDPATPPPTEGTSGS